MDFLEDLLDKFKFSRREFELCKVSIEKLFEEENQSHKSKSFVKISLSDDSNMIIVSTSKFTVYLYKKLSKNGEIILKSDIELNCISKNNIEKNSTRIRWIIEKVSNVIKLSNSSLEKIELFSKVCEDVILADLRKFGIILQSVTDKNYLYLYNNEFNFELKNNGYYEFRLNTSTSSIITKEKLSYINKVRDTVLKYWNKF